MPYTQEEQLDIAQRRCQEQGLRLTPSGAR
ncbi:hypothetical protein ASALC70_00994 [Alcanivorax sp. ALC70]|nr:hypothetical protein ASALC70_00994 [Alcanivorax sp. ALC70]